MAGTAREESLTPLELKRSIEAGKVQHAAQTQAGMGSGSGVVTIQGIRMLYLQVAGFRRALDGLARSGG